jgi:hypothetical protein
MKILVLLMLLTVGLVTASGCHWNHHHNHNFTGTTRR